MFTIADKIDFLKAVSDAFEKGLAVEDLIKYANSRHENIERAKSLGYGDIELRSPYLTDGYHTYILLCTNLSLSTGDKIYKIGKSMDISSRIKTLKGSPNYRLYDFELLAEFPLNIEWYLHEKFRESHIDTDGNGNELFTLSKKTVKDAVTAYNCYFHSKENKAKYYGIKKKC